MSHLDDLAKRLGLPLISNKDEPYKFRARDIEYIRPLEVRRCEFCGAELPRHYRPCREVR
jgi:hypothetical protein